MAASRRIYIIGFMGSGKSTTGKKLAANLGWKFIDLDKEIESTEGRSVREIFSSSGESYFRKIESETLSGLTTDTDTVISAGGGTPCFGGNMDFMTRTGIVVYLRMTPEQLKSRLDKLDGARPLMNNLHRSELLKFISDKLTEREEYYLKASIISNGNDLDIKDLSSKIKTALI
jgi:shikimate kinase